MPIYEYRCSNCGHELEALQKLADAPLVVCPSCNANNPTEMALRDGDETRCNYCGTEYKVRIQDDGRLRLKEL